MSTKTNKEQTQREDLTIFSRTFTILPE